MIYLYLLLIFLGLVVNPLWFLLTIPILFYENYEANRPQSKPPPLSPAPRSHHKLKPSSYVPANHSDPRTLKFQARKKAYMNSKTWRDKRKKVLARDGYQCQICHSTSDLVVHHMKDYLLIPHEPISSLVTLCQECHQRQHNAHDPLRTYDDYARWNHPI